MSQNQRPDQRHPESVKQPTPASDAAASEELDNPDALNPIDEAAYESFPASDPPSYTGAACSPSNPKRSDKNARQTGDSQGDD